MKPSKRFAFGVMMLLLLFPTAPRAGVWDKVRDVVNNAKEKAKDAAETAKEKASEAKESAKDAAGAAKDKVVDAVTGAKQTIKEKASDTAAVVKAKAADVAGKVSEKWSEVKTSVLNGISKPDDYELNETTVSDESEIPLEEFSDGSELTAELQRVAYPRIDAVKGISGASSTEFYESNENFPEWSLMGVSEAHRADTYIAIVSEPDPSDVENVVLIVAGQQGAEATGTDGPFQPNGFPNALTGQGEEWRKDWPANSPGTRVTLDARSLAAKLVAQEWFPLEKTFAALVFDSAFYYDLTAAEKSDMLDAYQAWLGGKIRSGGLKTFYLAGASRGGCLVSRLAKVLAKDSLFPEKRIFVSGFDAVCHDGQGELETAHKKVLNPVLYPGGDCLGPYCQYAFDADLGTYYSEIEGLKLFQIAGGGNVAPADNLAGNPRAFTYEGRATASSWYLQKWVPYDHQTICRSYEAEVKKQTLDSQLSWLKYHLDGGI